MTLFLAIFVVGCFFDVRHAMDAKTLNDSSPSEPQSVGTATSLVYDPFVLARSTLAAILSVLLLAMSSGVPVCDLSCSLGQLHSKCDAQVSGSSAERTAESAHPDLDMDPGMVMDQGQGGQMASAESRANASMVRSLACTHEPCDLMSAPSATVWADRIQLANPQMVTIGTSILAVGPVNVSDIVPEITPPKLSPVAPLFLSLRI